MKTSVWVEGSFPIRYCTIETSDAYTTDSRLIETARRAFETWGVDAVREGRCDGDFTTQDGVNQIGWGSLGRDPARDLFEAGVAQIYSSASSGKFTEVDIIIERAPPFEFQSRRCLLGTMLHEVGHLLGLEHADPPSIMQTNTDDCAIALTRADRAEFDERYEASPHTNGRNEDLAESDDDEGEVAALIGLQFEMFARGDWASVYELYSPAFRESCSFETFASVNEDVDPALEQALVSIERIRVEIEGDLAYVTYRYTYDGEFAAAVTAESPDVYVKIDDRWYDDIDEHTSC